MVAMFTFPYQNIRQTIDANDSLPMDLNRACTYTYGHSKSNVVFTLWTLKFL